ncbi:MAG: MOSC N-terminal beta barrel domain-containing protein [Verrucomicrobiales bacterium]|nr:MOSC N-terminal beta barrel domain-containing protein [Verrucomicrobiales bacterium]
MNSVPAPITELRITGLHVYPVKSCGGIALPEVLLTDRGFEWDREWMVVDLDGNFLTQRQHPKLALISVEVTGDTLCLNAGGRNSLRIPLVPTGARAVSRVTIWKHTCPADDEGDRAAEWLGEVLGATVRLVRFQPAHRRLSNLQWTGGIEARNRFTDGYPVLVLSEESLADLNRRLPGPALPMNRFRPNLVVAGGDAYVEDRIRALRSQSVELRLVKPCERCTITGTDQTTAEVSSEPLKTLASYRRDERLGGVLFAQNAIVTRGEGERLRVGDSLRIEWA